eukprot:TRINITY_DN2216_c0_g2_i1.p1 TRINITY_DN2216_c0_g2~~TRINITY_DN2216_c0_g2_i1.p1  ORF type:complete len:355 (-),score=42.60 TRINITY_DN2216_c0_g2_i1:89-1153(-)
MGITRRTYTPVLNKTYFIILFVLTSLFVLLMLFFKAPSQAVGQNIRKETTATITIENEKFQTLVEKLTPEQEERRRLEKYIKQEYEDRRTGKIPKPHSVLPANSSQYPKPYLFLHIPKTAGTTLSSVFQKNDPKHFQHFWLHPRMNEIPKVLNKNIVFGHFRYGLHTYFNRTCTYITMLRDPVDRVVSHYYYHRGTNPHGNDPVYQLARNSTLRQWVEKSPSANNEMTRCLSGIRETEILPTNQTLQVALQHLKDFGFVGLIEKFHESLVLMKYTLGFTHLKYTTTKQSKRVKLKDLSDEDVEYIKKVNWMDIMIYEEGLKIFNEQLKNAPSTFQTDLDEFNKEMKKPTRKLDL